MDAYRTLQVVLVGLLAVVFALSALARRFPHIAWLQLFRNPRPRLSDEQRAQMRRRSNIHAGVELISLGLVLPLVYVASTVMFFNDFTTTGTTLTLGGSVCLIGLCVTAIWRHRR